MKRLLILLLIIIVCKTSFAYENHWTPEMSQYASYMTVLAVVDIEGDEQERTDLEVGAFCGNECRGSKFAQVFPVTGRYIFRLAIYGNSGDEIIFRIYDHQQQSELDLQSQDTLVWEPEGFGTLDDPVVLSFINSATEFVFTNVSGNSWSTAANWDVNAVPTARSHVTINGICQLDVNAKVASLTINNEMSLTIQNNAILTVTELESDDASNLIIEDGGQLFTLTNNIVKATVKKNITTYGSETDNWFLVAPAAYSASQRKIKTNSVGMLSGSYDLYNFDVSMLNEEWQNYKDYSFSYLFVGRGYLYAHQSNITLSFSGTLVTTDEEEIELDYDEDSSKGFNLVGNPFPCNATVNRTFYVLNANRDALVQGSGPIAPGEAVFVEANGPNQTVTFTRASE